MKLLRIATLVFDRPLKASSTIELEFGAVKLTCVRATVRKEASEWRLAIAETELTGGISIDADGYIIVPDEPRHACENTIEFLANIIAVFNRCGRQISSAT